MTWDSNIYYNTPEPWVKIAEADWAGNYEFDTLVVWQNRKTGEVRAAHDSGCSCPTPFEDYETMADTTKIESVKDLLDYILNVNDYAGPDAGWSSDPADRKIARAQAFARDEQWAEIVARTHRALREDTTR